MSVFAHIAMLGWIPVVLLMFGVLPARRAAIFALLAGWLFLPMAGYKVSGLPDFTKSSATVFGIVLGTLVFDPERLRRLRAKWVDLPMVVWCLAPFAASISNGLGAYDGASEVMRQTTVWGLPYLVGRLYFTDLGALQDLVVGIVLSGIAYIPLCLIEIRFSPQLHHIVYGFQQHSFGQQVRYGGYRPMVFMSHGLTLAFWMATCGLCAFALWRTGAVTRLLGVPIGFWAIALAGVLVLCKSIGPLSLYVLGVALLLAMRIRSARLVLLAFILLPPLYVVGRSTQLLATGSLMQIVPAASTDRAQSLEVRLTNEDALAARALERPWFGWGGWGRSRIHDNYGKDISLTDGLWVIALGTTGAVGLAAFLGVFIVPVVAAVRRYPAALWAQPAFAPIAVATVVLVLAAIYNLPNADVNPVITAIAAGVGGLAATGRAGAAQHGVARPRRVKRVIATVAAGAEGGQLAH